MSILQLLFNIEIINHCSNGCYFGMNGCESTTGIQCQPQYTEGCPIGCKQNGHTCEDVLTVKPSTSNTCYPGYYYNQSTQLCYAEEDVLEPIIVAECEVGYKIHTTDYIQNCNIDYTNTPCMIETGSVRYHRTTVNATCLRVSNIDCRRQPGILHSCPQCQVNTLTNKCERTKGTICGSQQLKCPVDWNTNISTDCVPICKKTNKMPMCEEGYTLKRIQEYTNPGHNGYYCFPTHVY